MCPSRHRFPLQSSSAPVRDSLPPGPADAGTICWSCSHGTGLRADHRRCEPLSVWKADRRRDVSSAAALRNTFPPLDRLTQFGSAEGEFGRIAAPGSNAWELTFNVSATFLFFLCRQNAYRGARRNTASPVRISFASSLNAKAWLWLLAHDADDCETFFGVAWPDRFEHEPLVQVVGDCDICSQ
jgi:hypothetical protein